MKNIVALLAVIFLGSIASSYANDGSYSINWHEAKRADRNYGKIAIAKTDANPEGQTRIFFERCFHAGIGNLNRCLGELYKIDESTGWIDKEGVYFRNYDSNKSVNLPAGKYYMKMQYSEAGKYYYAMGEVIVTPFVTNFVHVQLE